MNRPTPWILLRGLTREQGHWGCFPERLQAAQAGCAVHCIDLPGNGVLNHVASPTRVEVMVDAARAELMRQGIAPPYRIVAMSLGAMLTVCWAHAHPLEIERAVLINTSLRPFSPFWQRLRPRNYAALLRLAVFGGSAAAWERTIFRATTRCVSDETACINEWIATRQARPVSRRNALCQLLAAMRYRAPLAPPRVPLLILSGARDALVDPRCSAQLAARWGAPLVTHPAAGHDLPRDDGDWVIAQIRRWQSPQPV
ncbi:alpha/beta hydrolase [Niveibacterium umoris]|uniref:Pimeloyl-ACP methyl ester carboxylesterase n=1 Tax=Niveibacterium umoris TaxID=1193620 RepID=A0A840BSH2_9RHOO|nr:alpha/beta hydrolase [Niveibacterium umoris]MBB4013776.1 pimeloyl-ACP methyl ester carboxylesterase [Niveibacterium umoris]